MPYSLRQTAERERQARPKQSEDGEASTDPSTLPNVNVQSEAKGPSPLHETQPAATSEVEPPDASLELSRPKRKYVDEEAARDPSPPGEITATVKAEPHDSESESELSSPKRKHVRESAEPVFLGQPAQASPSAPLSLFGPFDAPAQQASPSAYVSLFGPFDPPVQRASSPAPARRFSLSDVSDDLPSDLHSNLSAELLVDQPTDQLRTNNGSINMAPPRRRPLPSKTARSQSSLGLHPAAFPTSESSPADASSSVHVGIVEQMDAIKNNNPELREEIKATVQSMYITNGFIDNLNETQMKWYKQVLLRSKPYLEQSMNTKAPTFRSLWPSLRQTIIISIHDQFPSGQYTGFYYATRMILGLSESEIRTIIDEDTRGWETYADIPLHLRKLKELHPDVPLDPDMPPQREIVRAIEFLRESGLPGSLLGEWQEVPGAEHWVPRDKEEQEETELESVDGAGGASSSRASGTMAPPAPAVAPRGMPDASTQQQGYMTGSVKSLGALVAARRNSAVRPPPVTTAFPPRPQRFIPPTPRSQIVPTTSTPTATAPGPAPQAHSNDDLYAPPSPRPTASQVSPGFPMLDPHWHPAQARFAADNANNTNNTATNPIQSPHAPPAPLPAPQRTARRAHAFHSPHSIKRPVPRNLEPRHGPQVLHGLQGSFEEELRLYGPGAGMTPLAGASVGADTIAAAAATSTRDGDEDEDMDEEDGKEAEGDGDGDGGNERVHEK